MVHATNTTSSVSIPQAVGVVATVEFANRDEDDATVSIPRAVDIVA